MSIEKERELFELWCIKDDEFCIHRYAGSDDYSDDYTQCAWMAWQASANREGYKLVPVEPTQQMISAGMCVFSFPLDNGRFSDCELIFSYREMIGAIE
nr:MAG TPA: hypothetical protein [Caudoviricetes sp.]